MRTSRLTRVESKARTRDDLVTSARSVFLERGFHAATLEEIAEQAGYTKGAVYRTSQARTISSSPCSRALRRAGEGVRGDRRGRRRRRGDVPHCRPLHAGGIRARAGLVAAPLRVLDPTSRDAALRERLRPARERFLDSVAETIDGLGRRLGLAFTLPAQMPAGRAAPRHGDRRQIDPSLARDEVFEELFAACLRGLLVPTHGRSTT